jgi:type III restriction enzyme
MKVITLKRFQQTRVNEFVTAFRNQRNLCQHFPQSFSLTSPTGSGKTIMAIAILEELLAPISSAVESFSEMRILWFSDNPGLNEQTRRKFERFSDRIDPSKYATIDSNWTEEKLRPGHIHFLNSQMMSNNALLSSERETRPFTIFDIISDSIEEAPDNVLIIIDEAHRGTGANTPNEQQRNTILRNLITGTDNQYNSPKLVAGISATSTRYNAMITQLLVEDHQIINNPITVTPEEVRVAGLLKNSCDLRISGEPLDLLRQSLQDLASFRQSWREYCAAGGHADVHPMLVVQLQDGDAEMVTASPLGDILDTLSELEGYPQCVAHSIPDNPTIMAGDYQIPYIAAPDIERRTDITVVLFKMSLGVGWDCPRAEVMVSFRTHQDSTVIAQLIGRMVRTPLAETTSNDLLNSTQISLPRFDHGQVNLVRDYLFSMGGGIDGGAGLQFSVRQTCQRSSSDKAQRVFDSIDAQPLPMWTSVERLGGRAIDRCIRLSSILTRDGHVENSLTESRNLLLQHVIDRHQHYAAEMDGFEYDGRDMITITTLSIDPASYNGEIEQGEPLEIALSNSTIQRIRKTCDRLLGAVVRSFIASRLGAGSTENAAIIELDRLLQIPEFRTSVNQLSEERIQQIFDGLHPDVRTLESISRYDPETPLINDDEWTPPESENFPWEPSSIDQNHIFQPDDGVFRTNLGPSEERFIQEMINGHADDLLGWFRNQPRKAESYSIPWINRPTIESPEEHPEHTPMYPDFIVFRNDDDSVVTDIVEPHGQHFVDNLQKARGMAHFAERHGESFGRIALAQLDGATNNWIYLDLNLEQNRERVLAENIQELSQDWFVPIF